MRLTRFVEWPATDDSSANLGLNISSCPRETAIYLLHIAAEVEHALMAQYLYAAYSLGGDHLSPNTSASRTSGRKRSHRSRARRWPTWPQ